MGYIIGDFARRMNKRKQIATNPMNLTTTVKSALLALATVEGWVSTERYTAFLSSLEAQDVYLVCDWLDIEADVKHKVFSPGLVASVNRAVVALQLSPPRSPCSHPVNEATDAYAVASPVEKLLRVRLPFLEQCKLSAEMCKLPPAAVAIELACGFKRAYARLVKMQAPCFKEVSSLIDTTESHCSEQQLQTMPIVPRMWAATEQPFTLYVIGPFVVVAETDLESWKPEAFGNSWWCVAEVVQGRMAPLRGKELTPSLLKSLQSEKAVVKSFKWKYAPGLPPSTSSSIGNPLATLQVIPIPLVTLRGEVHRTTIPLRDFAVSIVFSSVDEAIEGRRVLFAMGYDVFGPKEL